MARTKQASKRKRGNTALPVLGAAGISLAMAGGASATPLAANVPSQDTGPRVTLGEEEISDVSLATFYVFDKENESELDQDLILLAKGGGCGGGGGCKCGGGGGCKCGGEEAVASAEGREAVASAEGAAAKGVVAAEGVVAEAYGLEPA
jgi:hypothetical protein